MAENRKRKYKTGTEKRELRQKKLLGEAADSPQQTSLTSFFSNNLKVPLAPDISLSHSQSHKDGNYEEEEIVPMLPKPNEQYSNTANWTKVF